LKTLTRSAVAVLCLFGFTIGLLAQSQTKLLRFPDIHGDQIAFCYAGDIWLVSSKGGMATRLTAHPGLELFPKFSPDGKWIAFTGQYDGDEQVYVIPTTGGSPRQLTFYPAVGPLPPRWGYDNQVFGWTPDGSKVLFRSSRLSWTVTYSRLFTVGLDGGLSDPLPMPVSGAGDLSPDGMMIAYSPLFRDFRSWKRYEGGWAEDLYLFDLATYQTTRITEDPRTDRDPMWMDGQIYFASDRTGRLNLFVYDLKSKKTKQITHSQEWDVRWPSHGEDHDIVYELGGELQVLDTKSEKSRPVPISVPYDGLSDRPSHMLVAKFIEDFELSPKGERALFVARGDVFTAPIEKGPTRNLTDSSGAHDKWARWSPDGAQVAFISDMDGEDEVYLIKQGDEGAKPEQLTHGFAAMLYAAEWSPDGKRLAFADKDGKVYVLTLEDKKVIQIADERNGQIRDYTWSPDGGHLAFSMTDPNQNRSIFIWSVEGATLNRATGPTFNEYSPAWDPEGNYLFYLSDREYAPQISSIEFNYALDRETGIYALALRKDVKNPFPPESDEVTIEKKTDEDKKAEAKPEEEKKEGKKEEEKKEAVKPVKIDFDGIVGRVTRVPLVADDYRGLTAKKGFLVYVRGAAFFYGRESDRKTSLNLFSLKDRKETVLVDDMSAYALSSDGSKVLVREGQSYNLYTATPEGKTTKKTVSTHNLAVDRVPSQEWAQIFNEVWRRYRDFFYVPNMHGYDWEALRKQYAALLPYVGHRSDLNYVISEMISELDVGHAYIEGGDFDIPERPKVALPGAPFELDKAVGRYRIAKILPGQNEEPRYRAPLTEVGVEIKEGDYILAIDGEELKASDDPYRMLRFKADRPVKLTVNSTPSLDGAREVTFNPVSEEAPLYYLDWVEKSRERVDKMSGGKIGYLHVPDMGAAGIREFIKWYYPQLKKEGLIVDVRNNGGGNVSRMLIERLSRKLLALTFARTSEDPSTYPDGLLYGPKACILNETSASDGDIFPAMFRKAGLGPLIGKRSWGGVVGITGHGPLIDGGTVYVPEFGFASPDGQWIIEGHGVDPDIVVDNDPASVIAGKDPQLERAVAEVMKAIEAKPMKLPPRPPAPVKTQMQETEP
jgi:tricorn protease